MSDHLRYFSAACAALFLSPSVFAQERVPEQGGSEIVVTGTRDLDGQLRDFVGALAPARGQIARFETAVCPAVLGLSASHKAVIERRLRTVAKASGLDVAPEGCAVNTLLMIADDKKSFINALKNQHPRYLGNLTLSEIRSLIRSPGPSAAWQLTGQVSARGVRIDTDGSGGDDGFLNRTTESPSRITAATRLVFEASALVVERQALPGLTTNQLADYAAMRLFARIDPAKVTGSKAPTIVTILDASKDAEVPLSLTSWDLGFLRGLYSGEKNVYSGAQRSAVAESIKQEMREAEKAPTEVTKPKR